MSIENIKNTLQPIFSVKCVEPEGEIIRSVYPMFLTPELIQMFWDSAKKFPTIYGYQFKDVTDFMNLFITYDGKGQAMLDGLFFFVPNEEWTEFVGLFYITNVSPIEADVHYSFFDKRHRGRVPLVKEMIRHIFNKYGFRRLNAVVPCYVSSYVRYFVSNVGFVLEGRKRSVAKYKDDWYDILHYGMLYTEMPKAPSQISINSSDETEVSENGVQQQD